jgi:GH25 family lysozyme M1 (1,4-beta-N-acetylmuramidase)
MLREMEYEIVDGWLGEVDRRSAGYIEWAQRELNRFMRAGLIVDGVIGPGTRAAVRAFQQQKGLIADGVVGPTTERALIAAGASPPPSAGTPSSAAPPTPARVPGAAPPGAPVSPLTGNVIFGLDTYEGDENKNPNWMQAKAQIPINFAMIRSNYGAWQDSVFTRDWPKIKDAGMVRGAYLFLRFPHFPPSQWGQPADPVAQAQALINTIKKVGGLGESDLPPTLDVEFPGGRSATKMSPQQLLAGVRAAWNVLKNHYGVAPIIYTSARVWKEDLNNLPAPDFVESPLWLAKPWPYKVRSPAVWNAGIFAGGRLDPKVPPPWGDATNWWIHQYQGDARGLPGFNQVDMNRFNTMIKGATGDRVKWVQRRLRIPQNGTFDAAMETVLRAFQQKKGLVSDGRIDPRTFAYLCWSNP